MTSQPLDRSNSIPSVDRWKRVLLATSLMALVALANPSLAGKGNGKGKPGSDPPPPPPPPPPPNPAPVEYTLDILTSQNGDLSMTRMNDFGDIVGRNFVYYNGTFFTEVDIISMLDPDVNWEQVTIGAINNSGQIGVTASGQTGEPTGVYASFRVTLSTDPPEVVHMMPPPGFSGTGLAASDINEWGDVCGISYTDSGCVTTRPQAVLWTEENGAIDLAELAGVDIPWSEAKAINDFGEVSGFFSACGGAEDAFRFSAAGWDSFGGDSHTAYDINNYGVAAVNLTRSFQEIVGYRGKKPIYQSVREEVAAVSNATGTGFTELGSLGGEYSAAYGINDDGVVVGVSNEIPGAPEDHAFVYMDGVMYKLQDSIVEGDMPSGAYLSGKGSPGSSPATGAVRINNAGQIAGTLKWEDGSQDVFIATPIEP